MTPIGRPRFRTLHLAALYLGPAALLLACGSTGESAGADIEGPTSGADTEETSSGVAATGGALEMSADPARGGGCDDDPCTQDWIDESGNCQSEPKDCDDGIGCTIDSCSPKLGCLHVPSVAACGDVADCAEAFCSPEPPEGEPGTFVSLGSEGSGCWAKLNHDWCAQDWDGCVCNGTETCQARPLGPGDHSGCAPESRDLWPCDQSSVGDQNGCTEENCCEEWNPETCRIHRLAEEATPEGEKPRLKEFCDKVLEGGEFETVPVAGGDAYCPAGDATYAFATGNDLFDDLIGTEKPDGYWCEDCNPCTGNKCVSPSGACAFPSVLDGNQTYEPTDEFEKIYWYAVCTGPGDQLSCDTDSVNHGCGREECWDGECRAGPNDNEDPSKSEECHGYPVFPLAAPETCFELGCDNLGSEEHPNWACVPEPIHELCDDGLFCDGPGVCTIDEYCPGCSPELAGSVLAGLDKMKEPPLPGSHLQGCEQLDADVICDDWVGCTIDRCDEVNDSCSNHPDDRYCSPHPQDWDPCHPQAQCLGEDEEHLACTPSDNPCQIEGEEDCERTCEVFGTARQCIAKSGSCEDECYQEQYYELELAKLEDLCPYMPTMPAGMDREYAGNGPEVDIRVDLSVSSDKHDVLATVRIEARETMGGDTLLQYEFAPIVVASTWREIEYIVSDTTGRARGHSNDGGTWGIACGGCGIVNFYSLEGLITHAEARGDTPNDDISHDDLCSDEVLIHAIELANIEVFTRSKCEELG